MGEFLDSLSWIQWLVLAVAVYCSMFIKRLFLIYRNYGILERGFVMTIYGARTYYAEYDVEQECHFYDVITPDGVLWSFATLEPLQYQEGEVIEQMQVFIINTPWFGIIDIRTEEDGWYDD